MTNNTRLSVRATFVPMVLAVVALWGASACVLYLIVKPFISLDNGRSLVFDPLALIDATSIVVVVVFLSWIPVLSFAPKRPTVVVTSLVCASTLVTLSVIFFVVENVFGPSHMGEGFFARASGIFANGSDIVFLPLVVPLVSVLSGIAYSAALWLAVLLSRRKNSTHAANGSST